MTSMQLTRNEVNLGHTDTDTDTDTQQLLSYYRYQMRHTTTRLIGCQLETIFGAVHINPNNRESTANIAFSTSPQTTKLA